MANELNSRLKVIIDTDIGDDIDDALALYFALRSPELEIVGITTVHKNAYRRAQIVSSLLKAADRTSIPVIPGTGHPIVNEKVYGKSLVLDERPPQFLDEMHEEKVDTGILAPQYLINTLKCSTEKLTLITLGALTNVALALMTAPEIAERIEKIVIMGGAFDMNFAEYNFCCDPEAAKIVLAAEIPTVVVGLDVTFQCQLTEEQEEALRVSNDPVAQLIMRMRQYWEAQHIFLHDPLAVAVAISEQYVTLEQRKVGVEIQGEYTRGVVVNLSGMNWQQDASQSLTRVCKTVDSKAFTQFYIDRVLGLENN